MLPSAEFLGKTVARLTLGDNPTNGHSYIPEIVSREEMLAWYTEERLIEQLFRAEELGYTVWQPLASEFSLRALLHYRDRGGKMDVIFQTHAPVDFEVNIRQLVPFQPLGVYHQGTLADTLFEAGKKDLLRDRIRYMQDQGLKAGFATHVPERIMTAEDEGWGCDFYMACLQNTRKRGGEPSATITGKTRKDIEFHMEDRAVMLDTIASVKTPVIAYKIFAGGQIFRGHTPEERPALIEQAYREVYSKIKPGDIAVMGAFQKYSDQLEENARILRKVLEE